MPAVSGKQFRKMAAVMAGKSKGMGPSKAVAREFVKATPPAKRKLWSKKRG